MLFRSSLLSALLLASSSAENEALVLPGCQMMTEETIPKFHQKCNREAQNSEQRRRQRKARHALLGKSGAYPLIPAQQTVVCPTEPIDLASETPVIGQDTRWIVENKSSGRVVICFLKNGMETSAMNPKITPPQADPLAILEVGEFKVLHTFEGHVFHVRELLHDGSMGDVLLQHRPGVVEFTNRFRKQLEEDDVGNVYDDEEYDEDNVDDKNSNVAHGDNEVIANSSSDMALANNGESTTTAATTTTTPAKPIKKRSPRNTMERCNMVYQGFRNAVGSPLDIYYAGVEQDIQNGPMQCAEKFKLHLGNEALDNTLDWSTSLKYEATFVGHTFVARLASNPEVVVDTFTLHPTEIHDCPRSKQPPVVQEQVIEFNGVQHGSANLQNNSTEQHLEAALYVDASSGTYMNVLSA